jgi:hypothetical protein
MRTGLATLALGLALGLAAPARAQQTVDTQQATSFFTGVNPRNINFTPIDTSSFYRQYSSQIIRVPQPQSAFSLSNVFRQMPTLSWPPRLGSSQTPNPKNNPFTAGTVAGTPLTLPK